MTEAESRKSPFTGEPRVMEAGALQVLLDVLQDQGYTTVGPRLRDEAIVYDEITSIDHIPRGWTDNQEGGSYRLSRRNDDAFFGYAVGPHSWKKYLLPPRQRLWQANKNDAGFEFVPENPEPQSYAFIGVRACELKAISIQDRVLMGDAHEDNIYASARKSAFLVALNCGTAGGTCFCVSMEAGPKCEAGYDLALTELLSSDSHKLLIEAGSARGEDILNLLPASGASAAQVNAANEVVNATAAQMGREMNTHGIRDLLATSHEHGRWQDVADRCLSCANCTMVCPTCFCTTVEDVTDLSGDHAERWRRWDSCFSLDFSYVHGGNIRSSAKSRYRQWLTHKLGTWIDQFGTSGCVGCGRCITWCPVGIDITEEIKALQDSPKGSDTSA